MAFGLGNSGDSSSGSLTGFGSQSSGSNGYGTGNSDPNSAEGLLELANAHGGAVAEAANEIVHPQTGILSTIGNGVKNAFKGFVNVLSMPNEIVAGALSTDMTIGEALKNKVSTSDVIFGQRDPNASTMQKVGSFLVRTATDVLLDPLTYVTFGASSGGLFGVRAATKIALGEDAAAAIGKEAATTAVVSKSGQNVYSILKKAEYQAKGLMKADELTGGENLAKNIAAQTGGKITEAQALDFTQKELKDVLAQTIDAPLNIDFAKKAMSALLEKHPQLTETLLDKGGVKIFGQSILSGQRISAAVKMIPGMTIVDGMTAPMRNAIQSLFDPEMVKLENGTWQRIPEEGTWLTQSAKDLGEAMKDDRITKLDQIVKAHNLTKPEAQFLLGSIEGSRVPADARLASAYKDLMGFNKEEFGALKRAGIPVSFLDKHVPHMLVKGTAKIMPFTTPPSAKVGAALKRTLEGTIFNSDHGRLEALEGAVLSKDAERINKMLGEMKNEGFEIFDSNIITAMAKRSADNTRAIVTKNFLDALPAHFAVTADKAPQGWRALKMGDFSKEEEFLQKVGKSADALRFHPAMATRIEKFMGSMINDDATNDALKAYDSLQNLWKASVTSIFPAFHGRNAISNVFLNFNDIGLQALNPQMHAISAQMVAADKKLNKLMIESIKTKPRAGVQDEISQLLQKKVFTDATGMPWSLGELRQVMKNNNIAFNRNIVGSMDITKGSDDIARDLFPLSKNDKKGIARAVLPTSQNFVPFKAGRAVGNAVESQARILNFMTNLKATGDVQLAAARTKQFLFDYGNLTNFEKTFLRRIMPFYSFTRKNLEMQARTLFTAPGRTAAQVTALGNLGDAIAGDQLTPDEEAALPDWIKSGIGILRKKQGSVATIYGSLGTPLEGAFAMMQPNQVLGSLSPIIRVPMELGTGYNFFQGKPISEVTNATAFKNAPVAIKNLIGYTEVTGKRKDGSTYQLQMSLRPAMMHVLLNLPPTTRVLTAMKQMDAQDVSAQDKTLQQLMGLKPYSFDLDQEALKRQNELKKKLQDVLTNAGVTAQFTRTYVPKQ